MPPHASTFRVLNLSEIKLEIKRLVVESLLRNPNVIAFYDGATLRYISKDAATPAHLRAAVKLQEHLMAHIRSGRGATLSEAMTALESVKGNQR